MFGQDYEPNSHHMVENNNPFNILSSNFDKKSIIRYISKNYGIKDNVFNGFDQQFKGFDLQSEAVDLIDRLIAIENDSTIEECFGEPHIAQESPQTLGSDRQLTAHPGLLPYPEPQQNVEPLTHSEPYQYLKSVPNNQMTPFWGNGSKMSELQTNGYENRNENIENSYFGQNSVSKSRVIEDNVFNFDQHFKGLGLQTETVSAVHRNNQFNVPTIEEFFGAGLLSQGSPQNVSLNQRMSSFFGNGSKMSELQNNEYETRNKNFVKSCFGQNSVPESHGIGRNGFNIESKGFEQHYKGLQSEALPAFNLNNQFNHQFNDSTINDSLGSGVLFQKSLKTVGKERHPPTYPKFSHNLEPHSYPESVPNTQWTSFSSNANKMSELQTREDKHRNLIKMWSEIIYKQLNELSNNSPKNYDFSVESNTSSAVDRNNWLTLLQKPKTSYDESFGSQLKPKTTNLNKTLQQKTNCYNDINNRSDDESNVSDIFARVDSQWNDRRGENSQSLQSSIEPLMDTHLNECSRNYESDWQDMTHMKDRKRTQSRDPERQHFTKECTFCKNNGKPPQVYQSHWLKKGNGEIICPFLRAHNCPYCMNGGGVNAHTKRHCPTYKHLIREKRKKMTISLQNNI